MYLYMNANKEIQLYSERTPHSIIAYFDGLTDPRVRRTRRHNLIDIMVIAICSLICGGESFNDMEDFGRAKEEWFGTFLELPNGIPSHDTFNRVFSALNPDEFLVCFLAWTQSLRKAVGEEIVAVDGKSLRRAIREGGLPHIVSAWAVTNGLVLGQVKVDEKSNEITAIPQLLRALDLEGCVVTIDAMGCQKAIAKEIQEADAEYVLALKGNQQVASQEIKSYLDEAIAHASDEVARVQTVDKGHGRLETRTYWQSQRLDWFADRHLWEGLRSIGVVESVREIKGQVQTERRYFLSSLPLDVERFARAVRLHWGIENQLHWVLDVQFGEDQCRVRSGHADANLATLRRLTLNLLKQETTKKRGIRGKQKNAGWDNRYLLRVLGI